jgi:hypothetical protein
MTAKANIDQHDYHCRISVPASSERAFYSINEVGKWWTTQVEGSSQQTGDVFTVRFGETFVTFCVTEVIPYEKISWLVTDCNLHWLLEKKEWKGTRLHWKIETVANITQIDCTHIGLTPQIECYGSCRQGWDFYIGKSLFQFISIEKGLPETPKTSR